ncbi:MAG TPA: leucyl/phenylalanyl-tRNA--protein transferase [Marmoricola sp.]|nr:leucyl/phenylalanyl-tRNA--protein transferase [Marmoricola sp.]
MPLEPPPSVWSFPRPAGSDEDLVAYGADLEPGTLLAAYRAGLFPMRADRGDPHMGWWSPRDRGVLPLDGLRVSRSLRQARKHFEIRVDSAFADVVAGCADPRRPAGWIDADIAAAYLRLHALGWAHSVEAWRDGELAGGLYGVAIGGLFAGESMFTRVRDASKVALVALVEMLTDEHADARLVDTQWQTPHLARLGVVEVPREDYLRRLAAALDVPLPAPFR